MFYHLHHKETTMSKPIVSQAERNALLRVAQEANPRHPPATKEEKRLASRLADYNSTMNTKDSGASKKEMRKANGGYHRPGSMQKH
jgi:hypothetical protein